MLSMPRGTDTLAVQRAAREFAKVEVADHKYVMVLHDHQANPHVHLSVRAESRHGKRLNPRKADLHRWRETFADKLRGYGIEAEATRQATRGEQRRFESLWQINARRDGRLSSPRAETKRSAVANASREDAAKAWLHIASALEKSDAVDDRQLAKAILGYVLRMPLVAERLPQREIASR